MHLTFHAIGSRRPDVRFLKSEVASSLPGLAATVSLLALTSLRASRERRRRLRDAALGTRCRENTGVPDPAASSGSTLHQVDAVGHIDFGGRVSAGVRESREERRPERCWYRH